MGKGDTLGRIPNALDKAGLSLDKLTIHDLAPVDHLHARGLPATVDLADRLPIERGQHILDIGCAVGGPARYLADRFGLTSKIRCSGQAQMGGRPLSRGYIYRLLNNPLYAGRIAQKGATYEGQHAPVIDAETWDAVRAMLAGNAEARRSGAGAREPSLLVGFLYDARGIRLSPSHAVKNGIRYRYYVSQAVLQNRDGDAGGVVRIPAREIEEVVGAQICALLKDAHRLIDEILGPVASRDQQRLVSAAARQAERWLEMSPPTSGPSSFASRLA